MGVSRSSTRWGQDGVASRGSSGALRGCEGEGVAWSEGSRGQGVLSEADLRCSLPPSFFGFMNFTKALAPIQWFFLVGRRVLGHSSPALPPRSLVP